MKNKFQKYDWNFMKNEAEIEEEIDESCIDFNFEDTEREDGDL